MRNRRCVARLATHTWNTAAECRDGSQSGSDTARKEVGACRARPLVRVDSGLQHDLLAIVFLVHEHVVRPRSVLQTHRVVMTKLGSIFPSAMRPRSFFV